MEEAEIRLTRAIRGKRGQRQDTPSTLLRAGLRSKPIVNTLENALSTFDQSDIDTLYMDGVCGPEQIWVARAVK